MSESSEARPQTHRGAGAPDPEALLGAVGDVVYTLDRDQRHTSIYGGLIRSAGLTPEDLLGKTAAEVLGAEDARVHERANREALAGRGVTYEWPATGPEGRRWYQATLAPVKDAEGEVGAIAGIVRDITDLKEAQDELRASRDFKELLLASLDAAVLVVDMASRRILECNAGAERVLGYAREELVGAATRMLHVDEDRYRDLGRLVGEAIERGETLRVRWRMKRKDGLVLDCHVVARELRRAEGRIETVAIIHDITERAKAERELRRSAHELEEAQRVGRVGSWSWDMVTGEVRWSDQLFRILGTDRDSVEPSRRAFLERVHPDDLPAVEARLSDALSRPGRVAFECRTTCPDGSVRYLSNVVETVGDQEGRPCTALGTVLDLTELKRAQKLKEDFLSMVSHELRTPLSSIVGYAALLERLMAPPVSEETSRVVAGIGRKSWEMVALVEELLEVSRLTAGKLELEPAPTDVAGLLQDVAHQVAPGARHSLVLDAAQDLPPVSCDAKRMAHVVRNLVANALKFSPDGGEVRVSAAMRGDRLRIEVSDQGIGIPPEDQDRIFGQFEQADMSSTRSFGGVGVGLYVVKAIVDAHHGDVSVASEPGKGSTFTVEIPAR